MCKSLARKSVVCISHRGHSSGGPGRAFEATWAYLLGEHVFCNVSNRLRFILSQTDCVGLRIKMNQVRLLVHCASLP